MHNSPFQKTKKIHFIGIGGIGMSGIAKIVLGMGYSVVGSDAKRSDTIKELEKLGVTVYLGHAQKNITADINVIVSSSAISPLNPEVIAGLEKKIPIILRGEMLAEIMRLKTGIAIAGTHGKTTTTSLISSIFYEGELSPTTIIGGKWFKINSNAELGKSHYLICESDESDGSFLKLSPVYSVVTNIDEDHMDFYKTKDNLLNSFLSFINKTPFYGKTFLCFDDKNIRKLKSQIKKPYASYGIKHDKKDLDLYASNIKFLNQKTKFDVHYKKKKIANITLSMLGEHNVLNALGSIGVALEVGIPINIIKKSLGDFHGVERRVSRKGKWQGLELIDDYAHHPTEIKATLTALKKAKEKVICIFQPHRYTRTLEHYRNFAASLLYADLVILTPIYSAGENEIPEVNSGIIWEEIKNLDAKKPVHYAENFSEIKSILNTIKLSKKGIILTLGAGDINQFFNYLTANYNS